MEDINDIILKYSGKEIIVVLDNNNKVWFNTVQICKILKYSNPNNITYKLIDKEFIKQLINIVNDYKIYPNAQPYSLFINEYGIEILFDTNETNNNNILLGGNVNYKPNYTMKYDDYIFINEIYNIIFNLF